MQPAAPKEAPTTKHSFYTLALTAVATNIDDMAEGVSFAFMDMNIFITAIGFARFTMVTISVMLGVYWG